jgi:hypothetical protein
MLARQLMLCNQQQLDYSTLLTHHLQHPSLALCAATIMPVTSVCFFAGQPQQ